MHEHPHDVIREEIAALDPALRARLDAAGFDPERLIELSTRLRVESESTSSPEQARALGAQRNRVPGPVAEPRAEHLIDVPAAGGPQAARAEARGLEVLRAGELSSCVMAGGMATRMGGAVKALSEVFDGRTFLDLRLAENATWTERLKRPVPLWLMTSDATDRPIRAALDEAHVQAHVRTFTQDIGLRLTPSGRIFRAGGKPSVYATGHGDLVDAVRRSGLLDAFRKGGGKYVWIANLDNLGATIDPAILGAFIESGADAMVEVVDKESGDRGGILVEVGDRIQILEEFRLPADFDPSRVRVFNTNTYLVKADVLATVDVRWSWFEVEKTVEGAPAIQFERLLQELVAAVRSFAMHVPRIGEASRFLPVKDPDELVRRRADIERVARARGMVR